MSRKQIIWTAVGGVLVLAIILLVWQLDIFNWQKLDVSKINNLDLSTRVYDSNDTEVSSLSGSVHRVYVELNTLPDYVYNAFVAAEDARFYSHNGVDVKRIFGALWQDIKTMSFSQGASTITQQLIKLTHLTSEKTLARKAQEAYLAMKLEKQLTKTEILEAYINTVYFGGGAYGIGAAAERYFGKSAQELTISEAALLAGIIKSPSSYAPHLNIDAALGRREYVIKAMEREGFISTADANAALDEEVAIVATEESAGQYAWYVDEVAREAREILGISYEELLGGGYSIYTGLSPEIQTAAEGVMSTDDYYPEEQAQGALIAMEPTTGEITALVGGREYSAQLGLNRATSARRQPGSLIKPVSTYAVAVEKYGYLPTSTVYDVQREYANGYAPGNSGGTYNGKVTVREALARSLNAATVDLADTVGVSGVADFAGAFGISVDESDENLALALGAMTYGATPEEMCTAYCVLASGGTRPEAHCIRRIADRYGEIIYEYEAESTRVVSAETAYIITDMLKSAATDGTARSLAALGMPVAAKTGTAGLENHDTSDAWATAYTPDAVVTVWFGRDSNANGGMPRSVTGGAYAAPACADLLGRIAGELSGADFRTPAGIQRLLVDGYALENEGRVLLASGNTPGEYVIAELFRENTELPMSEVWDSPAAVTDLRLASSDGETPVIAFTCASSYAEYVVVRKCRGVTEMAGIVRGAAGETVSFTDTAADTTQINIYSVIPRHALLYEAGYTLTGAESGSVQANPSGLLNGIASLFDGGHDIPDVESISDPLF